MASPGLNFLLLETFPRNSAFLDHLRDYGAMIFHAYISPLRGTTTTN